MRSFLFLFAIAVSALFASHASAQTALETVIFITDGVDTPKEPHEENGVLTYNFGNKATQIDTCHYQIYDAQDTWTYDFSGLSLQNVSYTPDNSGLWTVLHGVKFCLAKAWNGKSDSNNILKVGQCKDFAIRVQNRPRFEAALSHLQTFCKGRAF
ncbi:hypothetical protein QWJ07_03850 [Frankia sp. RB7]|nr:hypothetical protein [Frankia sp. RB7]